MRNRSTSVCVLLLALITGCGGGGVEMTNVSGTCTADGKPVTEGTLVFKPQGVEGAPPAVGRLGAEGKFEITSASAGGVALGTHLVSFMAPQSDDGPSPFAAWGLPAQYTLEIGPDTETVAIELVRN